MTLLLSNGGFEKAHSFPCPASPSAARSCWILEVLVDCSQQVLPKGITKMWNDFLLEEKNMSNKNWIPKATSTGLFFFFFCSSRNVQLERAKLWSCRLKFRLFFFFLDFQTLKDEIRIQISGIHIISVTLGRWHETNCNVRELRCIFSVTLMY